jgi:hypothetical protein
MKKRAPDAALGTDVFTSVFTSEGGTREKDWRRRPDLNRGWRFCRPLPYHLATAPFESCAGNRRPKSLRCARRLLSAFGPTTAQDATEERATTATAAHYLQAGRGAPNLVRSAFAPSGASADNLPSPGLPTVAHTLVRKRERRLERETGFEPATSTLARSHSTTELFPPIRTSTVTHAWG